MMQAEFPNLSGTTSGITVSRRSPLSLLGAVIRNPLEALPPEVFEEKIVYGRIGGKNRIHVMDPALIQEVLVCNADALIKGAEVQRVLGLGLGAGLLTADGAHWRWQRQSVASAFRQERLIDFLPRLIAAAEATRDRLMSSGAGSGVDIGREMMHTTFEIIAATMLSGRGELETARVEAGIAACLKPTSWMFAYSLLGAPEWLPYPGRRQAQRAITYLRTIFAQMIAARRLDNDAPRDLVDMLMHASDPESGRGITDGELIDNLFTFIAAGHETTALGLAWTFYLLARHPDAEARALEEIERVCGTGPVRPEHVAELVWIRQVLQEAMRLYPPVPIITRTAARSIRLKDFVVPANTVVYVPIYAVHRHRKLWDCPDDFDPNRFAVESAQLRHRYAYLPFGAGPRVCIDSTFATMEAVTILAVLLKAARLRDGFGSAEPLPTMRVTLRPAKPILMSVFPADTGLLPGASMRAP